jgi:hypothetical protein
MSHALKILQINSRKFLSFCRLSMSPGLTSSAKVLLGTKKKTSLVETLNRRMPFPNWKVSVCKEKKEKTRTDVVL